MTQKVKPLSLSNKKIGDKVKLKLIQPAIKCSGRKDVSCYYRGIITGEDECFKTIKIKSHQEDIYLQFVGNVCMTDGFNDIKII